MVLLIAVTAGASALLDNVTTVLLVAPVTLTICEELDLRPVPYLIVPAFASNIGGTGTLIGDPPNIIIASRADSSYDDFLIHLAPIVLVVLIGFIEEVEWPTLVFFMGLFVLVGGLVNVGVIDWLGQAAIDATGDPFLLAATAPYVWLRYFAIG